MLKFFILVFMVVSCGLLFGMEQQRNVGFLGQLDEPLYQIAGYCSPQARAELRCTCRYLNTRLEPLCKNDGAPISEQEKNARRNRFINRYRLHCKRVSTQSEVFGGLGVCIALPLIFAYTAQKIYFTLFRSNVNPAGALGMMGVAGKLLGSSIISGCICGTVFSLMMSFGQRVWPKFFVCASAHWVKTSFVREARRCYYISHEELNERLDESIGTELSDDVKTVADITRNILTQAYRYSSFYM